MPLIGTYEKPPYRDPRTVPKLSSPACCKWGDQAVRYGFVFLCLMGIGLPAIAEAPSRIQSTEPQIIAGSLQEQ